MATVGALGNVGATELPPVGDLPPDDALPAAVDDSPAPTNTENDPRTSVPSRPPGAPCTWSAACRAVTPARATSGGRRGVQRRQVRPTLPGQGLLAVARSGNVRESRCHADHHEGRRSDPSDGGDGSLPGRGRPWREGKHCRDGSVHIEWPDFWFLRDLPQGGRKEEELLQIGDRTAGHRSLPSSIGSVQLGNGAGGPDLLLTSVGCAVPLSFRIASGAAGRTCSGPGPRGAQPLRRRARTGSAHPSGPARPPASPLQLRWPHRAMRGWR